jgi:hypothetical protein
MVYSICFWFYLSVWIFGIAEAGIAHGSPPGTTTEVQRVGFPATEIRFISQLVLLQTEAPAHSFRRKILYDMQMHYDSSIRT